MRTRIQFKLAGAALGLALVLGLQSSMTLLPDASAQSADDSVAESVDLEALKSAPKDREHYIRDIVPEDLSPGGASAMGALTQGFDPTGASLGAAEPGIFLADVVVNNTNANLTNTDTANDGEVSIAVNPADPDEIVIAAFSGGWGGGAANAIIYHSLDGGLTWSQQGVPPPNGIPVTGPNDWTWDFGRNDDVSATVLNNSDVITGTTLDATTPASWQWNDVLGVTQITNIGDPGSIGNADQPWVLVNRDTAVANQDNVYVAYDDFSNSDGVDGVDMQVAVSFGLIPPNFTTDVQVGNSQGAVNPGLRMAEDPRTGFMWALFGRNPAAGAGGSKNMNYMLNRSTDGGATWGLNGSPFGIVIANADSTQPQPKFGTVNALLGGVHHAAVDPTTGDLYYVYGNRDSVTGNNRLAVRRVFSDGLGGVTVGGENFVTGQVQAAIPVAGVTDNGTLGIFYYTFDGFSSDDFPIFTAYLALSEDQGVSFTQHTLVTFLSSAQDTGAPRQRVLGDYHQMQVIGNCFYAGFTANGAPFGRPVANHDPIFLKTCVGPQIQVPANLDFGTSCSGASVAQVLDVCSTGTENLVVQNILSDDLQFSVTAPSSGFPVTISPDFCFPFDAVFTPASLGDQSATLTVLNDDPANPAVSVQAIGTVDAPAMTATMQADGNFGDVAVGDRKILNLEVLNQGSTCDLAVANIARTAGDLDFSFAGLANGLTFPVTLPPGSNLDLPIQFEPVDFNPKSATFRLTTDDPDDSPVDFDVLGDSPPPEISVSGDLIFGPVCGDQTSEREISICNVAELNSLDVTSVSLPDCDDFELANSPFPATISHDFCIPLTVRYTPTEAGDHTCTLEIASNDPDDPLVSIDVSGSTPAGSVSVSEDQAFPPTVIQSIGPGMSQKPLVISNTGVCSVDINAVAVTDNPDEYSLSGLPPGLPTALGPGEQVGDGALEIVFEPLDLQREITGAVTVTWETDPITEATADEVVALCGEGVHTGARVLVTEDGVPLANVKQLQLQRINANRNKGGKKKGGLLDTLEVAKDLPLETIPNSGLCEPFQYHREYGTVSNPIQLLPGSYQVKATAIIDGKRTRKTVGFSVDTTDFNQTIVIDFGPTS